MSAAAILLGLGYVETEDHGDGCRPWERGSDVERRGLVRTIAELAEREAALSASRLSRDPSALEHVDWLRRQRQAAETRLAALDLPPADSRQQALF